jgi:hypothetical protein
MAILFIAEGRKCPDFDVQVWKPTSVAKTNSTKQVKVGCYRSSLHSAAEFSHTYTTLQLRSASLANEEESFKRTDTLEDLSSKRQVLLPLEFEAAMHLHPEPHNTATAINGEGLFAIISKAQELSAPRKTYALFADMVLSSTHPDPSTGSHRVPTALSLQTAATLLSQIITAVRNLPDYDIIRASRWIRCLAQLCLDRHHPHEGLDGNPQMPEDQSPLAIIGDVVSQAVALARQSLQDRSGSSIDGSQGVISVLLYPAEELEWLSATLFNFGIDLYFSSSSSNKNRIHSAKGNGTTSLNTTIVGGSCSGGTDVEAEAEAEAKKWANMALGIADVLAEYPSEEGGDGGLLRGVLKGKMREGLSWVG